jgi:hypothetical protein
VVDIDYSHSSDADITVDVHPMQLEFAGGSVSAARQAASKGQLKLMKLEVLGEKMKDAINASPAVLNGLADYGHDARVALQIWVIMKAELADRVKTPGSRAPSRRRSRASRSASTAAPAASATPRLRSSPAPRSAICSASSTGTPAPSGTGPA